ncbi:MAG: CsbD family protein [Lautropia sp.]
MNEDQVKGAAKDVAGKVQQKAGEMTGSKEHQVKGAAKQVEGTVQKDAGDVKEAIKDTREDTSTNRP